MKSLNLNIAHKEEQIKTRKIKFSPDSNESKGKTQKFNWF